ncbi:MAG: YbaK/EbsC family protein [Chloroflexi bacterium]|nr:YbaK/EbsC family protein [Chloroflexota bacterium]
MSGRERLETYLHEQGVPFRAFRHPPAFTAQEVAAHEHVPGRVMAKVVMVMADRKLVMLVLPAPYKVDLTRVASLVGAKQVRLAVEDEFAGVFPDCEVGAMSPFGNLYGVPVYVDSALADDETIVFQAGTHTDTVSLPYADFDRLVGPTVGQFAYHAAGRSLAA